MPNTLANLSHVSSTFYFELTQINFGNYVVIVVSHFEIWRSLAIKNSLLLIPLVAAIINIIMIRPNIYHLQIIGFIINSSEGYYYYYFQFPFYL